MKRVIIVRYCEIFLKGKNKGYFIKMLENNIENVLKDIEHKTLCWNARYLIEDFSESDYYTIIEKLKKVAGVHSISPAYAVKTDVDIIYKTAQLITDGLKGTFKVETNRADKTFTIHSLDFSGMVGGAILDAHHDNLKVNVKNPDHIVYVDIREKGNTLVYSEYIKGVGGMPVGSSGKGMLLLSGGIDSPVSGYMIAKRGMKIDAIHYHSYPYTGEAAKQKVIDLGKLISEYTCGLHLTVVKFTHIQEAIHEKCPEDLMITMMRRFMMRIAERIAIKRKCQAIITGENLGQVASQTIESMTSSNSVVKMPVLRPVIAFDKNDIINIAKNIGTYETSILPYEDCCTVFLPKYPAIKPRMERVLKEEKNLDVEALIEEAISSTEEYEL